MSNTINIGGIEVSKFYLGGSSDVKIYIGTTKLYPHLQEPCFAVVADISQYSDRTYVDVYNQADDKWYKLNNLNQYEEYGIYGSGRTITYYDGKLTVDDGYEYQYSGGSWVNVGEVSGSTIDTIWLDPTSTQNQYAVFPISHYWGEGYKLVLNTYLSGSYSSDTNSPWGYNSHTPIEFSFYQNGFYYDFHNPTSTTAPDVYTGDRSWRIMKNNTLSSYENGQILNIILSNGAVRVELESTGAAIVTGSTSVTAQNWYNGLYNAEIRIYNPNNKSHLSHIQIYNGNNELVNDFKFIKNNGVVGSQEISLYDSVLDATYNNINSYTPSYHIVSESGGTEYPVYYDEIQDPPNNLTFSSMTEAEAYECPWVGMKATIDGDKYIFSGDSISGYEWVVYNPPTFSGKWLATYSDSHTESAQCDSSSSITKNEINGTNLVSVEIGDCVTSIGDNAFDSFTSLTSIDIPNSVTTIGQLAFSNCTSLSSVIIGSGVTSIGNLAFNSLSLNVTVLPTTPPTISTNYLRPFTRTKVNIYVPSELVDIYKADSSWSYYASRIQAIPNS